MPSAMELLSQQALPSGHCMGSLHTEHSAQHGVVLHICSIALQGCLTIVSARAFRNSVIDSSTVLPVNSLVSSGWISA